MSDNNDNNQKQGKQPATPATLKAQIAGEMKEARLKAVKQDVKVQMEKVMKAEQLLATENAALEEIFAKNADLFKK